MAKDTDVNVIIEKKKKALNYVNEEKNFNVTIKTYTHDTPEYSLKATLLFTSQSNYFIHKDSSLLKTLTDIYEMNHEVGLCTKPVIKRTDKLFVVTYKEKTSNKYVTEIVEF